MEKKRKSEHLQLTQLKRSKTTIDHAPKDQEKPQKHPDQENETSEYENENTVDTSSIQLQEFDPQTIKLDSFIFVVGYVVQCSFFHLGFSSFTSIAITSFNN